MYPNLKQYILVLVAPDDKGGLGKYPCNPKGITANAHDPNNWMTYEEAKTKAAELGRLVGFVLTASDPYFCLDIDGCITGGTEWSPLSLEIYNALPGCLVEGSVSGRGIHIWGRLSENLPPRVIKNVKLKMELYTDSRFICLGNPIGGDIETDATKMLAPVIENYFKAGTDEGTPLSEWTQVPVPEWSGPTDDEKLIQLALESRSMAGHLGSKATFQQLWVADEEALAKHFPPQRPGQVYDASSADAALMQHLAYYTGRNCQRVFDIMQRSMLKREKWETRLDNYFLPSIQKACNRQITVYNDKQKPEGVDPRMAGGTIEAKDFPNFFADCTYIIGEEKVIIPGALIVKPETFNIIYGGCKFFTEVDGKPTKKAFEAFTQCPSWRPPVVHGRCFRPELPPLKPVEENGRLLINTYVPLPVNQNQGDITPFLKLMEANYPNAEDRAILLSYMAAVVQMPGEKFGWAPLLQGPEGSGKTFLATFLAEAVGSQYSYVANADGLAKGDSKFNSWIEGKLVVIVNDIRLRTEEEMEVLKPIITDRKLQLQAKYGNQYTGDNRANFIFTTNHMDAVRIYEGGRRYAPFASALQSPSELMAAGLTPRFFSDLGDWANGEKAYKGQSTGFSRVAYFLHHYKIPDALNPATVLTRAPRTSVWDKFVASSAGPAEQEVLEAVAQGRPGFCGGWISSLMLDSLLNEKRLAKIVPLNARGAMLKRLGYEPHPGLSEGRATRVLEPDNGKPRLFTKVGSLLNELKTSEAICDKYTEANCPTVAQGRRFG